ncbi:MAG: hypothetical protein ACLSAP_01985 [Oscillospiraceae bacterium]
MENILKLTKRRAVKPLTHRNITIRLQVETCEMVDRIGEQTGRSRNEIVNLFIEYGLRHCVIQDPDEFHNANV